MRRTLHINQEAIAELGLIGKVDAEALCILDYIFGWMFCGNARCTNVDGRQFVWLQYENAVDELPLLFNPKADTRTHKNKLSRLMKTLRSVGLVESVKVGRDLYVRPSPLAGSLLISKKKKTVTKHPPTIMQSHDDSPGNHTVKHDDTVTQSDDDTVTHSSDDLSPPYIQGTTGNGTTGKQPPPNPQGDCERDVVLLWNALIKPQNAICLDDRPDLTIQIRQSLKNQKFASTWRDGFKHVAELLQNPHNRYDCIGRFGWVIKPASLAAILAGDFDQRTRVQAPTSLDRRNRFEWLDSEVKRLLKELPPDNTRNHFEDHDKYRQIRRQITAHRAEMEKLSHVAIATPEAA